LRDPRFVGEYGSFHPDYRSWSQREYGLRIGIFRVIDALEQAGICPVIAANSMAAERLPKLVQRFNDWGCEWLGHGIAATRMMHSEQSLEVQTEHIQTSLDTLTRVTGQRPRGWLSQDWGSSPATYDLLRQAGLDYTLDWVNDDQPYWMSPAPSAARGLLSIPLSSEWDDVQCQWLRNMEPKAHAALTAAAFERLADECQQHQRPAVFGLALHPWVCGMPSRIAALRELLTRLKQRGEVVWTQPGALFDDIQAHGQ
jgi:peptidoglycan/xylan/chitin deacetylase (PgdA/CDA1 family)